MQSKILSKRILVLGAALLGLVLLTLLLLYFFPKSLVQDESPLVMESALVLQNQEQTISGLPASSVGAPMRIKIPSINVDAAIEYVGITTDGAMDAPEGRDNVGWFKPGPRPGESGSAVMAGHYGWKNNKSAVFDNLYQLREGDKIYVEDDKGVVVSFVVRESRSYDSNADTSDVFGSSDGKTHLNLITCEGVWDNFAKSYSKRLVVFTDKE